MPPDMREWLPADHLVWFLLETVDALDTSAFHIGRRAGVGAASYDPDMLLALLVYAYCQGVRSSRQIERRCVSDVAFRVLCAQDVPDHATVARFRAEHEGVFAALFTQVLQVAAAAGLVRFGTVGIDGTKIAANASIDANRGQEWLEEQVGQILADARRLDAADDAVAAERPNDEDTNRVPARLRDRSHRAERIGQAAQEVAELVRRREHVQREREQAAIARLQRSEAGGPVVGRIPDGPHRLAEAEAHLVREIANHQAKLDRHAAILAAGKRPMGRPPVLMGQSTRVLRARRVVQAAIDAQARTETAAEPDSAFKHRKPRHLPSVVANTTDPQSRIMPTRRGLSAGIQRANCGHRGSHDRCCRVGAIHQRPSQLRAHDASRATSSGRSPHGDRQRAPPDRDRARRRRLRRRREPRRPRPGPSDRPWQEPRSSQGRRPRTAAQAPPPSATARQVMEHRLNTEDGRALYKRRGATVEPAIGTLKTILDRFSRRGLTAALGELQLAALAFNLMKIHRAANT
jgi:transposase